MYVCIYTGIPFCVCVIGYIVTPQVATRPCFIAVVSIYNYVHCVQEGRESLQVVIVLCVCNCAISEEADQELHHG